MTDNITLRRLEGLNHPEFVVRSEMLRIFQGETAPAPEASVRVIREIEKHGWSGSYEFPHQIFELAHTEESVDWIADRLKDLSKTAHGQESEEARWLRRWFCKAPLDWLEPRLAELVDLPAVQKDPLLALTAENLPFEAAFQRIQFAAMSGDELQGELESILIDCEESEKFPHSSVARMERVCRALRDAESPDQSTLEEWLEADSADEGSSEEYRAGAAMMVMAARGAEPPVDALIKLLEQDWDWWNELITVTLAASDSEHTFDRIVKLYPSLEWHERLFLTSAFEKLRIPGKDAAVISLAENEKEDDLRVMLAHAAALYGTEAARAGAAVIAAEHPDDPERIDLDDLLQAESLLLGEDETSTQKWLAAKEQRRKEIRKRENEFARLATRSGGGVMNRSYPPAQPKRKKESDLPPLRPAKPDPHPGIGRNDPCPCGSGKKYKKCCLRKA